MVLFVYKFACIVVPFHTAFVSGSRSFWIFRNFAENLSPVFVYFRQQFYQLDGVAVLVRSLFGFLFPMKFYCCKFVYCDCFRLQILLLPFSSAPKRKKKERKENSNLLSRRFVCETPDNGNKVSHARNQTYKYTHKHNKRLPTLS